MSQNDVELDKKIRAAGKTRIFDNIKFAALAYRGAILIPENDTVGIIHMTGTGISVIIGDTDTLKIMAETYESG